MFGKKNNGGPDDARVEPGDATAPPRDSANAPGQPAYDRERDAAADASAYGTGLDRPVEEPDPGRYRTDRSAPAYDSDAAARQMDYRGDGVGRTDYRPMTADEHTQVIDRGAIGGPGDVHDPAYADRPASADNRYDYVDADRTAAYPADDRTGPASAHPEDRFVTGGATTIGHADRDGDGVRDDVDPLIDERAKSGYRISTLGGLLLGILRILLGFQFLWAFLDKTFGLGFNTPNERAWINGGSPTEGYLGGVVSEDSDNPFKPMFRYFMDQQWTDWLFMAGLLAVGVCLLLGILTWVAAIAGAAMLVLMYLASWPIVNNPFLDDHLLSAVTLLALAATNAGAYLGLGKPWRTRLAHRTRKDPVA